MKQVTDDTSTGHPVTLSQHLCFSLYSTSLAITKLYQPWLKPLGLTYSQYLVMLALWEQENISVSDLGDRVQLDSGTLSPLLKRLEQSGNIYRRRDVGRDERKVIIGLTQQGSNLRSNAAGVPSEMIRAIGISADEINELNARIAELRQKIVSLLP
ncbi:Organic hydroperoxide resistance transcriptional regulator [Klebsiella pneumoniae]|uniref:MarR family winged helix-turn-helix transcriptional regulator n=1 Tax=Klebsiella pneumoniae TaxID=573 RepID=UPI001082ECC8|nr:MarR family transcriptional regulator [Klebsiella pneumoniae]VGH86232.1 Organic hydroperoxide resistance transcriptional regulator [Klebsiella pneumoniae]